MICGDDISRIPETTKPDLECNKEVTPASYAAAARSRPTSECNPDEATTVEDVVEEHVVEDVAAEPVVEDVVVEDVAVEDVVVEDVVVEDVVEDPVVEDVVEDPVVEDVAAEPIVEKVTPEPVEAAAPKAAPVEADEQKQSRAERKTKKAMMKLGLTAVEGNSQK